MSQAGEGAGAEHDQVLSGQGSARDGSGQPHGVERQGHTRSKLLIRSGSARRGSFAVPQVDPDDMREVSVEEDAYKNSDYFTDESTHEDFKKLRYTAIKTSPSGFMKSNYHLRHVLDTRSGEALGPGQHRRHIRTMVCINVDSSHTANDLRATLIGIAESIAAFSGQGDAGAAVPGMRRQSYREAMVVLACDRVEDLAPDVKQFMHSELFVFEPSLMKRGAASTGVKAHLFEHTQGPASAKPGSRAPLQLVMLSKAGPESGGKLNSHYWFFQALCTYVQPKFVYLLDAGIVPAPDALPRLQTEMTINRQLGACCGEITPWPENVLSLVSPVVAGQVFEFKTSYMMSKGLESMFGHVAHLPGGFTGYRYRAIAPDPRRPLEGSPLEEYLHPVVAEDQLSPGEQNVYQADDQMLSFELLCRKEASWTSALVAEAKAMSRPAMSVHDWVAGRRQWHNGAFFALLHALSNYGRMFRETNHSLGRKLSLILLFVYQFLLFLLTWFLVGLAFVALRLALVTTMGESGDASLEWLSSFFRFLYVTVLVMEMVAAFVVDPRRVQRFHSTTSIFLGAMGVLTYVLGTFSLFSHYGSDHWLPYMAPAIPACYLAVSLLHLSLLTTIFTLPGFLWMVPCYINVLSIHAFAFSTEATQWSRGVTTAADPMQTQRRMRKGSDDADSMIRTEHRDRAWVVSDKLKAGEKAEDEMEELLNDVADDVSTRQMYVMREALESQVQRIESKDTELRSFNFSVMASWVGSNIVLAAALEAVTSGRETFLAIIFSIAAFTLAIQVIGSVFYVVERAVRCGARRWRFRRPPASEDEVDVERAAGGGVDMRPVSQT